MMRLQTSMNRGRAAALASTLGGYQSGSGFMARCPVHEDRRPSLSIHAGLDGAVLVHCHAGCEQQDVIAALGKRGLWDASSKHNDHFVCKRRIDSTAKTGPDSRVRTEAALALWQASQDITDSLAETYLRSRGITVLPPPSLRFHPGLKHPSGSVWPVMIALVVHGETGSPIAIHRTFLGHDGRGKAPVDPQKMT